MIYKDKEKTNNTWKRTFEHSVISSELVWHRDKKDRIVSVISGLNWELQLENQLPVVLEKNKKYFIPKMEYHRVIKGSTDLTISITEK